MLGGVGAALLLLLWHSQEGSYTDALPPLKATKLRFYQTLSQTTHCDTKRHRRAARLGSGGFRSCLQQRWRRRSPGQVSRGKFPPGSWSKTRL